MKQVLLLGDSIRMFYQKNVAEKLGEEYNVFGPAENCRFAAYTHNTLRHWLPTFPKPDIIHWNNGLWDVCDLFGDGWFTSEQEYIENMLRVADLLLARYEKVIAVTKPEHVSRSFFSLNLFDEVRYNSPYAEIVLCSNLYGSVLLVRWNQQTVILVFLKSFQGELTVDVAYGKATVVRFNALVYDKQVAVVYPFVNHGQPTDTCIECRCRVLDELAVKVEACRRVLFGR